MSLLRRSLITWSPGFTSGDFIFNLVTAGIGVVEIGARQLNNWRLHEPPDLLPFCQPGVLSTRPYNSLMPRHHFWLPGRYTTQATMVAKNQFYHISLALLFCMGFWGFQVTCRTLQDDVSMYERHEEWMTRYGRVYKDPEEREKRFRIFKENVNYIETFNNAANKPY